MRKLLFLDIDGVFNSDKWYKGRWNPEMDYIQGDFDPEPIKLYNEYISTIPNLEVVIHSSWRMDSRLADHFAKVGLNIPKFEALGSGDRAILIKNYLSEISEGYVYCIIDDNNLFLSAQQSHLVQTDVTIGLTKADCLRVINILNK